MMIDSPISFQPGDAIPILLAVYARFLLEARCLLLLSVGTAQKQ